MSKILYLSRTGMLEPLGLTQVLSYLRGLSRDHTITLISFERGGDEEGEARSVGVRQFCRDHGIRWVRLQYRNRPRWLAGALNLATLCAAVFREILRDGPDLIHARSYIPATAAWAVNRLMGLPYVFDMRSLWPEELITSGRAKRDTWAYRQIVRMEGRLLRDAAAVVSVTHAAIDWLDEEHPGMLEERRVHVIPGSADLQRFQPAVRTSERPLLFGCHGSITTGWFRLDLLARTFANLAKRYPDAKFEIVTTSPPEEVMSAFDGARTFSDRLRIFAVTAGDMHEVLRCHDLSIFFYSSGAASEIGRSPVRMGEALACGLPVLTNGQIGDVAEIVRKYNVGVLLEDESEAGIDDAVSQVLRMVRDPAVSDRCRRAAEEIYSLDVGTAAYLQVYQQALKSENS
ncbi:glycosyltransferase family 4 protein [Erythrobacter sp. LQ02-29]|uniref:glycosyltransferase family 4 protein n=1 Tax=Erythrobacter sp. LQ02-29 TaxID=2920384 RepID=UPI001F4EACC0|nr:glycosyltransferase family 4 protein [Erythrobacter sp. LQ02-29]MCP9223431.1 glycosyltransferase family 4 protein [Erythrobacter sp. LQ02-29]